MPPSSNGRGQPAARRLDRQVYWVRATFLDLIQRFSGLIEPSRNSTIARYKFLHLRDVVDPPGVTRAIATRADDSASGAHVEKLKSGALEASS